jgi:hypothetical protein
MASAEARALSLLYVCVCCAESRVFCALFRPKGNLQALLGCNRNDIAARLQPKVQCKGTKPTLEQVKSQING